MAAAVGKDSKQISEEYKVWKKNSQFLCRSVFPLNFQFVSDDELITTTLDWPSLVSAMFFVLFTIVDHPMAPMQ